MSLMKKFEIAWQSKGSNKINFGTMFPSCGDTMTHTTWTQ